MSRDPDEFNRLLRSWRGRRLLACNACDVLDAVASHLGEEVVDSARPWVEVRPGFVPATPAQKAELRNAIALVLRLLLVANDGSVSPDQLHRF
jgi:hypothetical protein